jgi:hypothetical protein
MGKKEKKNNATTRTATTTTLELAKLTNTLATAGSGASSDVAIVAMTQKRQPR